MYLLYLTICTFTTGIFGTVTECKTIAPASYATQSLCETAGKQFANTIESKDTYATFTCEKTK